MTNPNIQALRTLVGEQMDARNKSLDRNPKHKRTRELELEMLVGVWVGLNFAGHDLQQMLVNWAFLKATGRDPIRG